MLVSDANDLKRATTLNGLAWAFLMIIRGIVAGQTKIYLGLGGCFVLDSVTYALSALILSFLKGDFKVPNEDLEITRKEEINKIKEKRVVARTISVFFYPLTACFSMLFDAILYLWRCGFGTIVMLKASGALCWGAADVLNVEYATTQNGEDASGIRLGIIFSCLGLGSLLGPILASFLTNAKRPSTTQLACVGAFGFIASSWVGMSQSTDFFLRCMFTSVRSFGGAIIYVYSTLLLQQLTAPELLGRVLAVDYMLTEVAFSISIWAVSKLLDNNAGLSAIGLGLGLATLSAAVFSFWSIYHLFGLGAARKYENPVEVRVEKNCTSFV